MVLEATRIDFKGIFSKVGWCKGKIENCKFGETSKPQGYSVYGFRVLPDLVILEKILWY